MPQVNTYRRGGRNAFSVPAVQVLIYLYICHKLLPAVGYYMPGIVYLSLFGLTELLLLPTLLNKQKGPVVLGVFAVSLLSTLSVASRNPSAATTALYGELQTLLYGMIAVYLCRSQGYGYLRKHFSAILAMYVITAITTCIGSFLYPQASRVLATLSSNATLYQTYTAANIGGFTFIYELVLLTPILISMIRSRQINRLLGYGILVLFGLTIIRTEYGMAVILFFVSVLALILPKLTARRLIWLLVFLIVFLVVGSDLVAGIFENLSRAIGSDTIGERLLAVSEILRGQEELSVATAQSRNELFMRSLETFVETGFIGAWGNGRIGGHSFVLDTMGNYGIIGIMALLVVLRCIYLLALKPYRRTSFYPYLLWMYLLEILMMSVNPKVYYFIFLLVIPVYAEASIEKERSRLNENPMGCK